MSMPAIALLLALTAPAVNTGAVRALSGPSIARPAALIASVALDELGVVLQVGDSVLPSAGRGLFICLDEGVEEAVIPSGTPLCGYCDGVLVEQPIGDKVTAAASARLPPCLRDTHRSIVGAGGALRL